MPDKIICDQDGEWHYHPWHCDPVCGERKTDIIPLITGGHIAKIKEVPWHVAIYYNFNQTYKEYICGGTIISSRIILSAAHCFWKKYSTQVYPKEEFSIAVGKTYRDYNAPEEEYQPQFFSISELSISD